MYLAAAIFGTVAALALGWCLRPIRSLAQTCQPTEPVPEQPPEQPPEQFTFQWLADAAEVGMHLQQMHADELARRRLVELEREARQAAAAERERRRRERRAARKQLRAEQARTAPEQRAAEKRARRAELHARKQMQREIARARAR